MKPIIGLIPLYDEEKDSYWMLPGYMKVVELCGGLPLMLPLAEDSHELARCLEICDGLLLTGGHDVGPEIYGQKPTKQCGTTCPARDGMELWLLQHALACDKPVFGICRGIQFMNAALGGTLYQDLPSEHPGNVEHHMDPPYDRSIHTVRLIGNTPLAEILETDILSVNSYHHQAIRELAPALRPMALAPDGIIEAVYLPGKRFAVGVQWHPEFSYERDKNSVKLVQAFVDACGQR